MIDIVCEPSITLPLLRAFTLPEHATAFLHGSVRLGLLSHYRKIEAESRRDVGEGEARHVVLGVENRHVHYGGTTINPIYIQSFASPTVDRSHFSKYGSHIVRLQDPQRFGEAVYNAYLRDPIGEREPFWIKVCRVRYNRDECITPEPDRDELGLLNWAQKSADFAKDEEVRLAFALSGQLEGAPSHLHLRVGPLTACHLEDAA